jgi:hypothetical protein
LGLIKGLFFILNMLYAVDIEQAKIPPIIPAE